MASHGIFALMLVSCVAVVAHDLFRTWEARNRALEEARREAANLARGASQQAEGAFRLVTSILAGLVERVEVEGTGPAQIARLRRVMAQRLAASALLEDLVLVDAEGRTVVDGFATTPVIQLGDREYSQYLAAHPGDRPYFGAQVTSRLTGLSVIPVVRRLDNPDGSFAGVLVATVRVQFFEDFYRTFNLGKDGAVVVWRDDGRLLIRHALLPRSDRNLDASEALRSRFIAAAVPSTAEVVSPYDHVTRLSSYRRVPSFPLAIGMALGKDEQLADWRNNAVEHGIGTVLLILVVGLVGNRLARQIQRTAEVDREKARDAAAANEDLTRLSRHLARARDRAEAASRAKSRFLASMSHELRTPLNGVLGYANLLRSEGGLTPTQTSRIDAMLRAGKHLLEMITCVLDLSEIEAGRAELQKSEFDAASVAAACLDLIRPGAEAKGLRLSVVVEPGTPTLLLTDATRLRQVLLNLLGNAVKFTRQGSIEVRFRQSAADGTLRIEVADTGPGIAPEQRSRLFQDFERLDHGAGSGIEGAGLGLALSAGVADMMGGRLQYEDNPGGGSLFCLELPVSAVSGEAPEPDPMLPRQAEQAEVPGIQQGVRPTAPLNLLLVDDVAMNRDIAGAILSAAGHHVVCAEGGAEAVAAAAKTTFDAILLDVRMPEVDGFEAARRIRALPDPHSQVPIIALTAQAFAEQLALCTAAGMDDYLLKPFEPEALFAALARVVTRRSDDVPNRALSGAPAVAAEVVGSNLATLDGEVFARTGSYLPQERVALYLQTIAERADSLLGKLREMVGPAEITSDLLTETHTLAGSAGMFGFVRLAEISRRFESAVKTGSADQPALLKGLQAALEATREEISGLSLGTPA